MPTRGLQVFACNKALRIVSQKNSKPFYAEHTPARTLVMSRTRIPANGRVGLSVADVARPLQSEHSEPLSRTRVLSRLATHEDTLEIAIVHQRQDVEVD